ncbi:MAG: ADP-ribosylglycohydrolase family protein [Phycisphaerales bacterium]|nr:MAG: ADP-ribosylglycohydrolase family protein [Phycisphaerales bacterium]
MHKDFFLRPGLVLLAGLIRIMPAVSIDISSCSAAEVSGEFVELSAKTIEDKIRGGFVGQMLGNLNGLAHENRYYDEPGHVKEYVPSIADGARTDDDTDIEWVYVVAMQRNETIMLAPEQITQLWKRHINRHIWCSNLYVRQLMDVGIDPPLTGNLALNPWANFNISGQFVCETFGLIAPGMPQTAAGIGLHYTHVSIDGEPAQATQLFTAMIATAFVTDDIDGILEAGLASIDPRSQLNSIVRDVRRWHGQYPKDWRTTRRLVRDKYTLHKSRTRNQNGYELCTAATVAAILYGQGDFVATLRHAFNFGWDADNNAATAGAVVGVIKGYDWMREQRWNIKDVYRNTTRPGMLEDETITSFCDRIIELAGRVIAGNGGRKITRDGQDVYRILIQAPANIERLPRLRQQVAKLKSDLGRRIEADLGSDSAVRDRARAAYLAICLGMATSLREKNPEQWAAGLSALRQYPGLLDVLFNKSPGPAGDNLRAAATAAGLNKTDRPQH